MSEVESGLPLAAVVDIWRQNKAMATAEFYAEIEAPKREGIDVNLWRALPEAGPEG